MKSGMRVLGRMSRSRRALETRPPRWPSLELRVGADVDFPKYFTKYAARSAEEKFSEICTDSNACDTTCDHSCDPNTCRRTHRATDHPASLQHNTRHTQSSGQMLERHERGIAPSLWSFRDRSERSAKYRTVLNLAKRGRNLHNYLR